MNFSSVPLCPNVDWPKDWRDLFVPKALLVVQTSQSAFGSIRAFLPPLQDWRLRSSQGKS
jgi:hypothetical protein